MLTPSSASAISYGLQFRDLTESLSEWEAISRARPTYFRMSASWRVVQAAGESVGSNWRSEYAWAHTYDPVFTRAAEKGINILPILVARKTSAAENRYYGEWEPEWHEWFEFVWTFVQRYGYNGSFWKAHPNLSARPPNYWEIWNEPNLAINNPFLSKEQCEELQKGSWNEEAQTCVQARHYAEFLVATAHTVRQAQEELGSGAGILPGGFFLDETINPNTITNFFNQVQKSTGLWSEFKNAFNAFSLHPYSLSGSETERLNDSTNSVYHTYLTLHEYISGGKPIWITELGWPAESPGHGGSEYVSETEQAELLRRSFAWLGSASSAYGIEVAIWYNYADLFEPLEYAWAGNSGLRTRQGTFRPAWYEFLPFTESARWPVAPGAETYAVTEKQQRQATVKGGIQPEGLPTQYHFEWGTSIGYGHSTSSQSAGFESGWIYPEETLGPPEGLTPNTNYHYRAVATNENDETSDGPDREFTTLPEPPAVTIEAPTGVTGTKATLRGTVNPHGASTTYRFEWGTSESYGSKSEGSAGSGTSPKAVEHALTGLKEETTYDYRLFAENDGGHEEAKGSFRTPGKPVVTTEPPTYTNTFEPQLNATVNPNGADTHYQFEYGETEAYGSKIPATAEDIGSGTKAMSVSATLKGLKRNQLYHYRVVAENVAGTSHGTDKSFTTLPACKGAEEKCTWSTQTTVNPPPQTEDTLEGVSCKSSTECLAVGQNHYRNDGFVELWNGTEWKIVNTIASAYPHGISCGSTTSCMAWGYSGSELRTWKVSEFLGSWSASSKTIATPANSEYLSLSDISCSSESACTLVGHYWSTTELKYEPLVERWNGTAWSLQTAPDPSEGTSLGETMHGVSCNSSTECTTVGYYKNGEGHYVTFIERWNGSEWKIQSSPNPTGASELSLEKVSCSSSSACMAVGHFKESGGKDKGFAESWNGSAWSVLTTPTPAEAEGGNDLYSVSCLSASSCSAVGRRINKEEEPIKGLHVAVEERTLAETWNGTEWSVQTTQNPEKNLWSTFTGVSCTSSIACTAVGTTYPKSLSGESLTLGERYE